VKVAWVVDHVISAASATSRPSRVAVELRAGVHTPDSGLTVADAGWLWIAARKWLESNAGRWRPVLLTVPRPACDIFPKVPYLVSDNHDKRADIWKSIDRAGRAAEAGSFRHAWARKPLGGLPSAQVP
jgi:hypothetical protein